MRVKSVNAVKTAQFSNIWIPCTVYYSALAYSMLILLLNIPRFIPYGRNACILIGITLHVSHSLQSLGINQGRFECKRRIKEAKYNC